MNKKREDLVVVGVIKGAHGVRGDVRIKSFTEAPEDLFSFGALLSGTGETLFTPESSRAVKDHFVVRGTPKRQKEEWDAMRGVELHISRLELPKPDTDEFYFDDMIGLRVEDEGGVPLGKVTAAHNFGASDVIEIQLTNGLGTVTVPFTHEDFPQICIEKGVLTLATLDIWTGENGSNDQ